MMIGREGSHDATSTPRAPLCLALPPAAFVGFFLVDEGLGLDGHVYDVWGGPELKATFYAGQAVSWGFGARIPMRMGSGLTL